MSHVVFLDPTGGQKLTLHVIVGAPTGVIYRNPVNGYYTEQRELEGFLIPVGDRAETQKIYDWFWTEFGGWSRLPELWTEEKRAQLAALIAEIPCWLGDEMTPCNLQLDITRIEECVEAWIPVVTPYGRGILTLMNSD